MIKFPVSPHKAEDLKQRMAALGVVEADLRELFYYPGRGKGRKSASQRGVHLVHRPSGIRIQCQESTSQALNRFLARRELIRTLEMRRHRGASSLSTRSTNPGLTEPVPPELPIQHMFRMFSRGYEKDVVQPFPHRSDRLSGLFPYPPKLIRILGERDRDGQ